MILYLTNSETKVLVEQEVLPDLQVLQALHRGLLVLLVQEVLQAQVGDQSALKALVALLALKALVALPVLKVLKETKVLQDQAEAQAALKALPVQKVM
jgi:hypothetical protein